jgi:uncharacterized protein YicC (UPF0701 family)
VNEAINYVAMVLSVVSLVVTVIGFFAALKFYRDGVELQGKANDALTKIEEKTAFIQTQVGGMFDKTLEAAIGKRAALSESFTELSEQLEITRAKIIEESLNQIGEAGEQERKRIKAVVDTQIEEIKQKVKSTRESAEEVASLDYPARLPTRFKNVLKAVSENSGKQIDYILDLLDLPKADTMMILHRLAEAHLVSLHETDVYITAAGAVALERDAVSRQAGRYA